MTDIYINGNPVEQEDDAREGDIRITKCVSCGQTKECQFGPDPYGAEIHNDMTPIWQCNECAFESAMDI